MLWRTQKLKKKVFLGAKRMGQWLGALPAHPEDPGSIPTVIWNLAAMYNSSSKVSDTFFYPL